MTGTSILDVLTNGIGALLLLMLIFVRMMGEPPPIVTEEALPAPNLCSAPLLFVSADAGAVARPIRWNLRWQGRGRQVSFDPDVESAEQIHKKLLAAGFQHDDPVFYGHPSPGVARLALPVAEGDLLEIEAFPEDGPTTGPAALDVELLVPGARLRRLPASPDAAVNIQADWQESAASAPTGPSAAIGPFSLSLPLNSAAATDYAHFKLSISFAGRQRKSC